MALTVVGVDGEMDHLLPLIQAYGCHPALRIGLAQPALAGKNAFLHPKLYPKVGKRLAAFAVRAGEQGARLEFDCGFVRCMFSAAELNQLSEANAYTEWRCNPVLDIDLQGEVSPCFPLAGRFQAKLEQHIQAGVLRQQFASQLKPFRTSGIYKECSTCQFKANQECTGGCLAATLMRFRPAAEQVRGAAWN
jgi:MoaA/NifB/PqqE/SkfB family radical SAM enzyme